MKRHSQSGNAVVVILIGIALFGALAFTFMQGSKSGQGNLTSQQAKIAAQELLDFFTAVDRAANKLRQKGCSENDISFSSPKDTGVFITFNSSATAPVDKSCHVFDENGGKLNMNMQWEKYQTYAVYGPGDINVGNINFKWSGFQIVNVGTAAPELAFVMAATKPEICDAYNELIGLKNYNPYVSDADPILGDENTAFAGQSTFCRGFHQIVYVWSPR